MRFIMIMQIIYLNYGLLQNLESWMMIFWMEFFSIYHMRYNCGMLICIDIYWFYNVHNGWMTNNEFCSFIKHDGIICIIECCLNYYLMIKYIDVLEETKVKRVLASFYLELSRSYYALNNIVIKIINSSYWWLIIF